jgi:adenine-specific DNA-methyltransferase
MICNEIFGESQFVCQAAWVSNRKGRKQGHGVSGTKEYILCYRKQSPKDLLIDQQWAASIMPGIYTRPNYKTGEDAHGSYVLKNQLPNTNSKFNEETAPTMVFDIFYNPTTHEFRTLYSEERHKHPIQSTTVINPYVDEGFVYIPLHPNAKDTHQYHAWRWSREKINNEPHNLVVKLQDNGRHQIWTTIRGRNSTHTGFKDIIMGPSLSTKQGSKDIAELNQDDDAHPLSDMFQFPKPVTLVQALIESCTDGDDLILDFFSGSGTTAHAVLSANARDGQNRRFMLVQLPEPTYTLKKGREVPTKSGKLAYNAGYRSIDALARERIRRVEYTFDDNTTSRLDCGFQAYHIAPSWLQSPTDSQDQANQPLPIEQQLRTGWTEQNLMTECLLKLQEPVPHQMKEQSIDGHRVFMYSGSKTYFGVFDHPLTPSLISTLRTMLPQAERTLHIISFTEFISTHFQQVSTQEDGDPLHLYLV